MLDLCELAKKKKNIYIYLLVIQEMFISHMRQAGSSSASVIDAHPRSWCFLIAQLNALCKFSSVQLLSGTQLFVTPWTRALQASLSITNSWSLPKLMSIKSVMPSNYLILCHPLLLLPSIFHSIRIFSNESALCIRWPKYWSFSFSISPSNKHLR